VLVVAGLCLATYLATLFGGLRSPDEEVVFRVCESLATRGTFAVAEELPWRGFGLATGRDGQRYSVFGPLLSLVCVPFYSAGAWILGPQPTAGAALPYNASFILPDGPRPFLTGQRPAEARPHALRFLASGINPLLTALAVALFAYLARRTSGSASAALATALLFGLGSLAWPYSGTFFSEPLATTLVLGAFALLAASDPRLGGRQGSPRLAVAGLALGAAVAAHVTSLLFIPFGAAYAACLGRGRERARALGAWGIGLALPLLLLALYNSARFGSIWETGRGIDAAAAKTFGYGTFTSPWTGLWGLSASSGKGLVFYCPAVLVGLAAWPALRRRRAPLAWILAAMALTRIVFVASRSDWHGGFCLGPRLLVPLVPFLLLPVAAWIAERRERLRLVSWIAVACALEQLYFALAELMTFRLAQNVPDAEFEWSVAPLLHLWSARPAPFWLAGRPLPIAALWLGGAAVLVPLLAGFLARVAKKGAGAREMTGSSGSC